MNDAALMDGQEQVSALLSPGSLLILCAITLCGWKLGGCCWTVARWAPPLPRVIIEHMFEEQPGLQVRPTSSFPAAQDYGRGPVSLDQALICSPAATFVLRVEGDGLRPSGILDGDELVVNRALDPCAGYVVIVVVEGQHRVGRLLPAAEVGKPLNQEQQPGRATGMAWRDGVGRHGPGVGAALDAVTARFGTGALAHGVAGLRGEPVWAMRRD